MRLHSLVCGFVTLALALGLLAGCSKQEQPAENPGTPPAAASEKSQPPVELTEAQRQELQQLGEKLAGFLAEEDVAGFKACFDDDLMIEEALTGLELSGNAAEVFKKGLRIGLVKGLDGTIESWTKADHVKFKGVVTTGGKPAVRFRIISEDSGIAFVDLITRPRRDGHLMLVNVYNHSLSFDMLAQYRQMLAPFLAELDKNVIRRLFNRPQLSKAEMDAFIRFGKDESQGNLQACVEQYPKLAPALRDSFAMRISYLDMLQKLGDDAAHHKALKETAAMFKSEPLDFLLVDMYFAEKDYTNAVRCVENFAKVMGPDAALLILKASLLSQQGNTAAARESALEALKVEPDCVYAHEGALDVLLAAGDFKGVRDSMIFLEKEADYEFKGALTDDVWKEFLKSPEASRWR